MTQVTTEIRCPICGSNQITADKKILSGDKAVMGGFTYNAKLLAETIGANNVKITCLACGKVFKSAEGKIVVIPATQFDTNFNSEHSEIHNIDQRILEFCKQGNKLAAVKVCKDANGWDLKTSKDYVDNLALKHGVTGNVAGKTSGCFVATACYGNYDAPEVIVLRNYRDEKLLKTFSGKLFVSFYYSVSPFFAKQILKSDFLKKAIRQYFLEPIVKNRENTHNPYDPHI